MSLVLGIRFLCGRVTATHPADRETAEWPIHPDRVFMALAAAHFETGGDPNERAALEWLEQQHPQVICSAAATQDAVTAYVPVNDTSAPRLREGKEPSADQLRTGLSLLPENRSRQPRQFPTAYPEDDRVFLVWDAEPTEVHRDAIDALCRKVTYVGHSSSLVQMWLQEGPVPEIAPISSQATVDVADAEAQSDIRALHLVTHEDGLGQYRLRVAGPGRLAQLQAAFERNQRPTTAVAIGYDLEKQTNPEPVFPQSLFSDDLIVLRQVAGPRLAIPTTQRLTHALRQKILGGRRDLPEWLCGHGGPNNGPSQLEGGHMALIPLPHVGTKHADGHLLGAAIVLPRDIDRPDAGQCLRSFLFDDQGWPKPVEVNLSSLGTCTFQMDDGREYRQALQSSTWTGPSHRWATVTPICLDRHPRGEDYWQHVEAQIADGCERIGLPRPMTVIAAPSPMFVGVPHGKNMPCLERHSDDRRIRHTHAVLLFESPIRGPVIVGAGRYRGYGLCRPLARGRSARR